MAAPKDLDVSTFLDDQPTSGRQWGVFILCMVVLAIDGFDTTSIGFIAPALIDSWDISKQSLGPVMMSGLLGVAVGCIIAGPLADRYGRRLVIVISMLIVGVWSIACAFSTDIVMLSAFRFLTGLGLGASMPNAATLVSEFAPKRRRSQMVASIYSGFAVGAALGGFGSDALISNFGWGSVFIVGGVIPLVFCLVLIRYLPESTAFLLSKGEAYKPRLVEAINRLRPGLATHGCRIYTSEDVLAGSGSVEALFSPKYLLGTMAIWLMLFVGLINLYLLSSWLPLLVKGAGMTLGEAALIGAIFQAGGIFGNLAIGLKMDRWGHHKIVALTILGGAITAAVIGLNTPSMRLLIPLGFVLGYFVNSANGGAYALAAQFYPAQFRATGVSWATGIGRLGSITGAGIGATMLALGWGFRELFLFLSIPASVGILALVIKYRSSRNASAHGSDSAAQLG
ncbi:MULTISPECIES: MFS transporter [Pseudomonas]|uniref:4-hydroxybenzoate transporter n=1 Tax=Pseudomonas putida S13.1.2 TaxID=1384061 RepID=A0AAU8RST4_PSEPU|nr:MULTISPECIES: MFS transporter [Pseudomonas]AJQ46236.1 4-hydroxybenzoate transporter [Pseudomonas putida S13.1.2]